MYNASSDKYFNCKEEGQVEIGIIKFQSILKTNFLEKKAQLTPSGKNVQSIIVAIIQKLIVAYWL